MLSIVYLIKYSLFRINRTCMSSTLLCTHRICNKNNRFCKMFSGVQKIEKIGHCNIPSNIYLQVCEKYLGLCHTQHFYFYEGDKDIGEFLDIFDTQRVENNTYCS